MELAEDPAFLTALENAAKTRCVCGSSHSQSLTHAADRGCPRCCAKFIHEAGTIRDPKTALMYATLRSNALVVQLLRYKEAKITTIAGMTALMFAVQQGNLEMVELLAPFEAGVQDQNGVSALMLAVVSGYLEIVKVLLPLEKKLRDSRQQTAFHYVHSANSKLPKLLLDAVFPNHAELTRSAMETPCPHNKKCTSLSDAMQADCVGCCAQFIHQAGFRKDDQTALMKAAAEGHFRVAELLLPFDAGIRTAKGVTALMKAAMSNNANIVELLAPHEGGVSDNSGVSALMLAAQRGHLQCVKSLLPLEAGMLSSKNETAATLAVKHDHLGCFQALRLDQREFSASRIPPVMLAACDGDLRSLWQLRDGWKRPHPAGLCVLDFAVLGRQRRAVGLLTRSSELCRFFSRAALSGPELRAFRAFGRPFPAPGLLCWLEDEAGASLLVGFLLSGDAERARFARPFCAVSCEDVPYLAPEAPGDAQIATVLRGMKTLATSWRGRTAAALLPGWAEEARGYVAENPLRGKEIALALGQVLACGGAEEPDECGLCGEPADQSARLETQFGWREGQAEARFNRALLSEAKDVLFGTAATPRHARARNVNCIRDKHRAARRLLTGALLFMKRVVQEMLDE